MILSRRRLLMQSAASSALLTLSALANLAHAKGPAKTRRMPVIFVGHGSPMNAIQDNTFTRHLAAWGEKLPKPSAILSVSAHWLTPGSTAVDVQMQPRTIYDFGGFPQALYDIRYPAAGAPAIAEEAAALVKHTSVQHDTSWGLDHGTWTVLHHLYPKADIPVFQLSIDYARDAAYHYAIGRELAALRDRGVLIMGSGNIVHNLRMMDRGAPDALAATRPWAQSFDSLVKKALAERDDKALIAYQRLEGASIAVATPDHYYPFLYALGAAGADEKAVSVFEGFQGGTLSMRCLQFGAA